MRLREATIRDHVLTGAVSASLPSPRPARSASGSRTCAVVRRDWCAGRSAARTGPLRRPRSHRTGRPTPTKLDVQISAPHRKEEWKLETFLAGHFRYQLGQKKTLKGITMGYNLWVLLKNWNALFNLFLFTRLFSACRQFHVPRRCG